MADTITANYSWVKPEPGASNSTWGVKLNADLDSIDGIVKGLDDKVNAPYVVKTGNYTALVADNRKFIQFTGAFTLSLPAVSGVDEKYWLIVSAFGGDVTIDPNGAEEIDDAATFVVQNGKSVVVHCTGAGGEWRTSGDPSSFKDVKTPSINGGPLSGFRNKLINARFTNNQRNFAGGALAAGIYGFDRWKADTGGANMTLAGAILTIASGTVVQVVEGVNIEASGGHVLSWVGTATATVDGVAVANGASANLTAGTNATVKFTGGTVSFPQLEYGTKATAFEQRVPYERQLCMRYFQSYSSMLVLGHANAGNPISQMFERPILMRTAPSNNLFGITGVNNTTIASIQSSSANSIAAGALIVASGGGSIILSISSDAEL